MIIINTTFILDPSVSADALEWIKGTYAAGFSASRQMLARIIADEDAGGYAMHLYFDDMASAKAWDRTNGTVLRQKLTDFWGEKALAFCTFLQTLG